MDKKTKKYLIIGAIVLVIIVSIAVYFYYKGKKTTTQAPLSNDNPDPTGPNNSYGVSASQISQISDALYSDMSGFNWLGHATQPYQDLSALSDTDFEKVYNDYNTKHQAASNETFTQWINGEDFAFADLANSIRQRLGSLNLK